MYGGFETGCRDTSKTFEMNSESPYVYKKIQHYVWQNNTDVHGTHISIAHRLGPKPTSSTDERSEV